MSSLVFTDLQPPEAVARAREAVAAGRTEAFAALDRHLRWHLVNHLQNRTEDADQLLDALLAACHWVKREGPEPWSIVWPYLLELFEDAASQPSLAVDLDAVEGRAAEMLALLARAGRPLRPSKLQEQMGLTSLQQVSNLGNKLEKAGLIVRRRSGGKATWIFPTPRGSALAAKLPVGLEPTAPEIEEEVSEILASEDSFWSFEQAA